MENHESTLFFLSVMLFLIMDPIGNIGCFLTLMQDVPPAKRRYVLLREMGIALLAMLVCNYLGEFIFSILEISETTVRIASGLILLFVAIKILFPAIDSLRANLPKGEPFIIPLAIPLIAGPSLLATIMLYASLEPSQPHMLEAILIATVATTLVLWVSPVLQRYLGNNGLLALEKLTGMILVLLAVQRLAEGVQKFYDVYQG